MTQFVYQIGFMAYFNLNQKQLAQSYCVNKDKPQSCCKGKCYLGKKLSGENSNTPSEKQKIENEIPVFVLPINEVTLSIKPIALEHREFYNFALPNGTINNDLKPPRFS